MSDKLYARGQAFVGRFVDLYETIPPPLQLLPTAIVIYQWADAVNRTGSPHGYERLITALGGACYQLLKGQSNWRAFDHQNIQTGLMRVQDQTAAHVMKDP